MSLNLPPFTGGIRRNFRLTHESLSDWRDAIRFQNKEATLVPCANMTSYATLI
jgi:hypothetical protein